ncbi:MAG TPA: lysine--tRNA ligase [Halobacteria archaeon]|nr:lysine--tRNA ligase [Halobacteria archaeon]
MSIHWADRIAEECLEKGKNVIATGITPSGEIHIGNMREVLTGDMIYKALLDLGGEAEFLYIADTFDPLRRLYPFLPESYKEYVGQPLYRIPDPFGCHESYSEHFLDPFLKSLEILDVHPKIYRSHELYKKGLYEDAVRIAIENRDKIAEILESESKRKVSQNWSPYTPLCANCGKINGTEVISVDGYYVKYRCNCGHEGRSDIRKDDGKLGWRIDWPARWRILNVTIEPFGKDHATVGGSYDTGKRVAREIYEYEPPYPVVYEWISLKGHDMSSSKGIVVSIYDVLKAVPPEALRYLIASSRPNKHLNFDPGLSILKLINNLSMLDEKEPLSARELRFSRIEGKAMRIKVPFEHMVNVVQISKGDLQKSKEILARGGYHLDDDELKEWSEYAINWLKNYAPESVKFSVQETIPESALSLDKDLKEGLKRISERLSDELSGEDIHNIIYQAAEDVGIKVSRLFEAIYIALLDKKSGPRAGLFIKTVGIDFVKRRFKEVADA